MKNVLIPVMPTECLRKDGTVVYNSHEFRSWLLAFSFAIKARFPKIMSAQLGDNKSMIGLHLSAPKLGLTYDQVLELECVFGKIGKHPVLKIHNEIKQNCDVFEPFSFRVCILVEHALVDSHLGILIMDPEHYSNIKKIDGATCLRSSGRLSQNKNCITTFDHQNFGAYEILHDAIMLQFGNDIKKHACKDFNKAIAGLIKLADFVESKMR